MKSDEFTTEDKIPPQRDAKGTAHSAVPEETEPPRPSAVERAAALRERFQQDPAADPLPPDPLWEEMFLMWWTENGMSEQPDDPEARETFFAMMRYWEHNVLARGRRAEP